MLQSIEPESVVNLELEAEPEPELELRENPQAMIAIGAHDQDFLTQDDVEQRIRDSNATKSQLEVFNGQLNRNQIQEYAQRLVNLFRTLSPGGANRLRHRDAANMERATNCVLSFYSYYIVLQSMTHSEGELLGRSVMYGHVYRCK